MSNKVKQEIAIALHLEFDGDFAHIRGRVVKAELDKDGYCASYYEYEHVMAKIEINSQAHRGASYNGMYATEVHMDCHRTGLQEAKRAVSVLTPIERKLTKMYETEGNAASFGAWINRVARAVGAKRVFVRQDREYFNSTGCHYQECSVGDSVYRADALVAKVAEWANPSLKIAA